MDPTRAMPAAFIGHGSPMNTLEDNRFTAAWRAFGAQLPRPRAVLAVSAHWFIHGSALTAMQRPRVIHDFYGFPPRLFAFDYPAPGAPAIAEEIAELVKPAWLGLDRDSWGLDHGTWSVLAHVFPKADVPVIQLSVHAGQDAAYRFELGERLAPLRERGILVIGSGNAVHNLRAVDFRQPELAFDWALDFDEAVREAMAGDPRSVLALESHPAYRLAVPTPDHYLPLLYVAGMAGAAGRATDVLVEGCTLGSISMTSFVLAAPARAATAQEEAAAGLPDPRVVPPDQTNT